MPQSPKVLKRRDAPSLAKYIQSNKCKNIVLMLGAGVSTSAGIPDFRSPKTGLYANLARLKLPRPEAVFDIDFFRRNPEPFYTLAQELYPGKFRPTITHSFIRLLAEKGLLSQCFTQNIDTLERRAGVPADKIIEAHGSFATQRCIDCHLEHDDERMKQHILSKKILRCDRCKGLVKPDIVFFGESLPEEFFQAVPKLEEADLLMVLGTSLTVHPFAALPNFVNDKCPRVLMNLDRVGDFGKKPDDVILLGKCDDVVKNLCQELGWLDELMDLWAQTEDSVEQDLTAPKADGKAKVEQRSAEDEVEQLVDAIEQSLSLSDSKGQEEDEQAEGEGKAEKADKPVAIVSESDSEQPPSPHRDASNSTGDGDGLEATVTTHEKL